MVANLNREFFNLKSDPRVREKVLMGSPYTLLFIVACYLLFSNVFKNYIRSLKQDYFAYSLKALSIYNIYAFIFSNYFLYKIVKYMIWSNYDFRCMALDLSTRNETIEVKMQDVQK